MNIRSIVTKQKVFVFAFFILFSCSDNSDKMISSQEASEEGLATNEDQIIDQKSRARSSKPVSPLSNIKTTKKRLSAVDDLGGIGLIKMEGAKERLLEYKVNLVYHSIDFFKARNDLLSITSLNGFIVNSTTKSGTQPQLHSKIHVKSDRLFEVIKQLNRLGRLESERIQTVDHTEGAFLQKQKIRRERLRQNRRSRASSNTGLRDWKNRERLLSQSEDKEDHAIHENWKIKDRVSFAQIQISVYGPKEAPAYIVPLYKKAFIDLINLLLELSYIAIYLFPFVAFIAGITMWIKKRGGIFRK